MKLDKKNIDIEMTLSAGEGVLSQKREEKGFFHRLYQWACEKVHSRFAPLWLGLIFILEIVLIIPLDAVLVLYCLQKKEKRHLFVAIATIGSVLSGVIGYLLGWFLWDLIGPYVIGHFISQEFFTRLTEHYAHDEALAIMIGSFLPIPFKAISLSAGFCQIPFWTFVFSVLAARAVRFFLIAKAVQRWKDKITAFIDRHFSSLMVAVGAKVALTIVFFFMLSR
ncbi:MAG: DedA family protein [Simkania sp.]|nr:DedA family protein [Simkania sp.]